jgi:hypothetical protein
MDQPPLVSEGSVTRNLWISILRELELIGKIIPRFEFHSPGPMFMQGCQLQSPYPYCSNDLLTKCFMADTGTANDPH